MALCCTKSQVKESIKVGFVYIGDESNPYVYNFIRAQKSIENQFGDKVQVVEKFNVPENAVEEPLVELAKENVMLSLRPVMDMVRQRKK